MVYDADLAEWGSRQHDPADLTPVLGIGARVKQDPPVVRRHPHLEEEKIRQLIKKGPIVFHFHPYMEGSDTLSVWESTFAGAEQTLPRTINGIPRLFYGVFSGS